MKKSNKLMQREAKFLQQVRVMGINRVKGPYIHTKCKCKSSHEKNEVLMVLDSACTKLVNV